MYLQEMLEPQGYVASQVYLGKMEGKDNQDLPDKMAPLAKQVLRDKTETMVSME